MSRQSFLRTRIAGYFAFEFDPIDLVTIMTALVVLVHGRYSNEQITTALAFSAVLLPFIRRSGPFWIVVFIFRFLSQVPHHWTVLDNHQHLLNWWCLGLGLVLMTVEKEESLRILSRLMIGLCFLFAAIWKIRSPDFLTGDFLSWRFTTDARLREFAESFLGLPVGTGLKNSEVFTSLWSRPPGSSQLLVTGEGVRWVARAVSWYTVLIEGFVAILYLAPQRLRITQWAPWVLLVFIVTVYPVTPIIGFASSLVVYSIGASKAKGRWTGIAIPLFIILPFFQKSEELFALLS